MRLTPVRVTARRLMVAVVIVGLLLTAARVVLLIMHDARQKAEDQRWLRFYPDDY
jgi:hypothetical protein